MTFAELTPGEVLEGGRASHSWVEKSRNEANI